MGLINNIIKMTKKITYKVGQNVKNSKGLKRLVTKVVGEKVFYLVKRGKLNFKSSCTRESLRSWSQR